MKLGILTFHSQLNYGGVLQCWALKEVLKGMGHEVVVIDRWLDETNSRLMGGYRYFNWKGWLYLVLHGLMGCGQFGRIFRHKRTQRFVRDIGLTSFHFVDWKDAPTELGVDCLVVGSDQVWHGGDFGDPRPYLLECAPKVNAIAYAASFGLKELPTNYDYEAGFRRFDAISVREADGVNLVQSTGYPRPVSCVLDPTVLLPREKWNGLAKRKKTDKLLVCYFLAEDINAQLPLLSQWASVNAWRVKVLCADYVRATPRTPIAAVRRLCELIVRPRVRVCVSFGPKEFVRTFSQADACITDSFHALMFSSIYDLNVRFIRPNSKQRQAMFSRIEDFSTKAIDGELLVDNVKMGLASILSNQKVSFRQTEIEKMRLESLSWLRKALNHE